MVKRKNENRAVNRFRSIILSVSILIGTVNLCLASSSNELDTEIQNLQADTNSLQVDQPAAFDRLKTQTNLIRGPLIVGGIQSTTSGSTIDWLVSYVASTYSVTALQFDLEVPISFSVVSVTAGPASLAANKSVEYSSATSRGIIFGLNQTVIGSGVIAIVQLKLNPLPNSFYPVNLLNPVASDANGHALLISAMSGTVEVK